LTRTLGILLQGVTGKEETVQGDCIIEIVYLKFSRGNVGKSRMVPSVGKGFTPCEGKRKEGKANKRERIFGKVGKERGTCTCN